MVLPHFWFARLRTPPLGYCAHASASTLCAVRIEIFVFGAPAHAHTRRASKWGNSNVPPSLASTEVWQAAFYEAGQAKNRPRGEARKKMTDWGSNNSGPNRAIRGFFRV